MTRARWTKSRGEGCEGACRGGRWWWARGLMGGQDGLDVGGHQELTDRGHDVCIYAPRAVTRTRLATRLRGSERGQKQKAGPLSPTSTSECQSSRQTIWVPRGRYRGGGGVLDWMGGEGGYGKNQAKLDREALEYLDVEVRYVPKNHVVLGHHRSARSRIRPQKPTRGTLDDWEKM